MNKETTALYTSLPFREFELLKTLYLHRCLSFDQIFEHFFKSERSPTSTYCTKRLTFLVNKKILEKVSFEGSSVYFLTKFGVEFVCVKFQLPSNVYDVKKNVVKRGYFRASELRLRYKNIRHQLHLNAFALETRRRISGEFSYYDEKHLVHYRNIRPDGLISALDTDFFIEIDMGTETIAQLKQKWSNYRNFLLTNDFLFKEKKIVVLFVVEGVINVEQRTNLIKKTLAEAIPDCFKNGFDIFVGVKNEMINVIDEYFSNEKKKKVVRLLRQQHFSISNPKIYARNVNHYDYHFIVSTSNKMVFMVDFFDVPSMSLVPKSIFKMEINAYFQPFYKQNYKYLIVCESEKDLYRHIQAANISLGEDVYFTTPVNLENAKEWHQAFFQLDSLGNIFAFEDALLERRKAVGVVVAE